MKKIVICTGANGGIGKNYCREMLANHYHVVLATRTQAKGQKALEELQREFPNETAQLMLVDMGDLASIQKFSDVFSAKYDRLDVLAHNAGVYFFDKERKISKDGIELNFAIHVVGPFALTASLFPILVKTPDARIVSMSSSEHRGHQIDISDPQMENDFSKLGNMEAYNRSKWALLAFTFELQKRIEKKNLKVNALAAHPGVSITGIQHSGNPNIIQRGLIWIMGKLLAGKPEDAAKPLAMASLQGVGGEFYGPTGFKETKGKPGLVKPDPTTKNSANGNSLWKILQELSQSTFNI